MFKSKQPPVNPTEIFNELAYAMKKHGYRPTEEERQNVLRMRRDKTFAQVVPAVLSGYASWWLTDIPRIRHLSGSRMLRLMPAGFTALFFAALGESFSDDRSLRVLAHQPGPMGGELCELIRRRNPSHPLLRDVPVRMEGNPAARIATWQDQPSEHPRTASERAPASDYSSSSSPHSQQSTGRSGQGSRAPGGDAEQGLRETPQPSAEWGDAGGFSVGELELGAFSSAADQGPDVELQQQQQRHSQRRSREEERRRRRQQHAARNRTGGGGLDDYFDQRWEEPPPK